MKNTNDLLIFNHLFQCKMFQWILEWGQNQGGSYAVFINKFTSKNSIKKIWKNLNYKRHHSQCFFWQRRLNANHSITSSLKINLFNFFFTEISTDILLHLSLFLWDISSFSFFFLKKKTLCFTLQQISYIPKRKEQYFQVIFFVLNLYLWMGH